MTQPNRPRFRIAKRQYRDFKQSPLRHVPLMTAEPPLPISGLSQHDSFYKQMFENNRAVKLVMRQDNGQIIDANPAACQFYGYTYQQITALHITDINILPHAAIKALMNRTVAEKGIIFQTQHRLASGDIRDVEVFSGLIEVDQVAYLYSIIQDITERKHAEKALRESEALYRLFAQNMPDSSVVMFDTDMRHTLAEGPFLKTFGSIYQSAIGKTPQESLPKALADNLIPVYQRALQGESFTDECLTKNFAYESFITPVRGEKGTIIGGMILSHDISKRHSAATALKETETRYQSVINTLSEGIVLQTADGSIQACNTAAEAILGLTADQMMGRTSIDPRWRAIHEDGSPFPGETHPAMVTLQTGRPLTNIIMGVHKPDGTLAWISVNSRPMLRPDETLSDAVVATFVDITERKRLEDDLRANEAQLRLITDNMQDVVSYSDVDDRIHYVNSVARKIMGFDSTEIVGKSRHEFIHPDDWENMVAIRQRAINSHKSHFAAEGRIRHDGGHYLNIETVGALLYDTDQNYNGGVYITRDITERKRLEEELRASKNMLAQVIENIPFRIFWKDQHSVYRGCNTRHAIGNGLNSADEIIGKTDYDFLPERAAEWEADDQKIMASGQPKLDVEELIVDADGSSRWLRSNKVPMRDTNGETSGVLIALEDITERKRLEEALRTNEEHLRLITDNITDMILQSDEIGRVVFASPSIQSVLGYKAQAMLGASTTEYIHPDDLAHVGLALQAAIETGRTQLTFEYRARHADGHYLNMETACKILKNDQLQYIGTLFVTRDITERKRLENALSSNERKMRLITDHMQDFVTQNDVNGRMIYVSPSAETMLGYTPESLIGTPSIDLIHPDDRPQMGKIFRAALAERAPQFRLEARLRHADGHYIPVETVGRFVTDDRANLISGVFISRDVTERKRLEDTLRANESQLRLITDNMQDIVSYSDANDKIHYVNPVASKLMGFDSPAIIGKSREEFIPIDDWRHMSAIRDVAINLRQSYFTVQGKIRHASGHCLNVETVGALLYDDENRYKGGVYITRDITERKRLEEALRANEQRLRLITDNMADLVTLTDGNRRSTFVSPSFTTLLGYDLAVLENASILEYIHPDDGERIAREVFTARTSGQSGFSTEFRLRHADGHYIEAETVGKFTYAPNGDFIGTVLITRDITERNRFQETLIQHEKLQATLEKEYELSALKSRMMERITHEFRTPLSIIQISAENLHYYYERLTPERREAKMTAIQGQIRRITDMLDEIALVVKGSFIPDKLNRRTVDLSLQCRSLAQELEKQSNTPGKYQLDLPDSINVQLDVPIFDNALLHIMRNAARFSDQLVPVVIKLSHTANTAQLQVIDSGIGILPHELPHVFEPFFRGSNINERGGIGVGLTIARAAIEAHGGTITIDSTLGQGTTVTIRLPA